MSNEMKELGQRIRCLREAGEVSVENMAAELEIPVEHYRQWEETGEDVPISAIYHMARHFNVEFAEIMTGKAAKLDSYQIVRRGKGKEVDRYPGYNYEDLAWRFDDKLMQPLLVTLDPSNDAPKIMSHAGQEFNAVVSGTVILNWGNKEFTLEEGDTIYFDSSVPHAQRCGGEKPARFLTVIAE